MQKICQICLFSYEISETAEIQVLTSSPSLQPKICTRVYISVGDPGCVSRIPDPTVFHPGSRIRIVSIPDPNCFHPGSASKNLSILTQKMVFKSSRKYDPGCSS